MSTILTDGAAAEVRAEMARANVGVAALAERVGVSPRTVSRWINGHQAMGLDDLEAVSDALHVDPLDLLSRVFTRAGMGAA